MLLQTEILQKAGINQTDIRQLETLWNAYQAAVSDQVCKVPHIICTGIYNAGKSTLLNALCGEEKFPTGDIPTTKAVAQAEFNGAVYIDTPGLNAEEEDDQETLKAYQSADFILFVANVQNGSIGEAEAGWLNGLRERYTADSLRQRLLYVLTHCGQIEPEQIAVILDKTTADLEKILGFAPDSIFCVDSVIYQKGIAEDKPLMVEYSALPQLQSHLTELIKRAGETLRQAREVELCARRKELTEQINQCQVCLRRELYQKSQKYKEKIAAVDRVWEDFNGNLPKNRQVNVCSRHIISLPYPSGGHGQTKSESEAKRKLESALRSTYDSRERVLDKVVGSFMQNARNYTTDGIDSPYFLECDKINQAFEKVVLELKKIGIPVQKLSDISIKPDIPSGLAYDLERNLRDDVVQYGGYYSLSKYIDMYANIYSMGSSYEKGFLGIMKEVPCYYYNIGEARNEMNKDMDDKWNSNATYVNRRLNDIWQNFFKKLTSEVNSRKAALKSQVDTYRGTLKQELDTAEIETAISHLDALEKEVSQ